MSPSDGAAEAAQIIDIAEEVKPEPPHPLMRKIPSADPFPVDALGDALASSARAIHDRVRAPIAMCAQSVLAVATLAVQAHADVVLPTGQAKPLSLYFATVGFTGERKSAVDNEALWPVRKREAELRESRDLEHPDYLNDLARLGEGSRQRDEQGQRGPR
jgi:putative DNA primase/helicase